MNIIEEKEVVKYQVLMKRYEKTKDEKLKEQAIEIRNRIIEQNIPLILDIADKRRYSLQMSIEELLNIGVIAMIKAIDEYAYDNKNEFTKYAEKTIANAMSTELNYWCGEGSINYGKIIRRYKAIVLGEYGSKEALYDEVVMDYVLGTLVEREKMSKDAIPEIKSRLLSQKATMEEAENIEYETDEDIDKITFIRAHKDKLFESLTDYEKNVVEYIYGFKDGYPYSVKEVAEIYGVKHQVTSQTYQRALIKMRKNIN